MRPFFVSVCLLLVFSLGANAGGSPPTASTRRLLVVCVDGVGYDLALEMSRKGELPHFFPPAPVINSFPSLTNVGLTEILAPLNVPPARGYEDYFFDPARNRMEGGLFYRLSHESFVEGTYRRAFDYHPPELMMTADYALPVLGPWLSGEINFAALKSAFLKSAKPVFLAYFDSSDLSAHLYGKWLVRSQLRQLDRLVGEVEAEADGPIDVIVFSDHGNRLEKLRRAPLEEAIRWGGFRLDSNLQDDRSVVLPQFGLVSAAVLYVSNERRETLAEALHGAEGVDLVTYREGDAIVVLGRAGNARVERREGVHGTAFAYRIMDGDPLDLKSVREKLERDGRMEEDGFADEQSWLLATETHSYPDPLRRLWSAFDGLVEQPAGVIVSLQEGYYFGSEWLDLFAWMRATHGSLRAEQSRGVVLSTNPGLFLPDAGPFTGENLWPRLANLRKPISPRPTPWQLPTDRPESVSLSLK